MPYWSSKIFKNAGFDYIHIIDLNAAKSGGNENLEIIKEICKLDNINTQVGGGIRSIKKINNLFAFGVDRVIGVQLQLLMKSLKRILKITLI